MELMTSLGLGIILLLVVLLIVAGWRKRRFIKRVMEEGDHYEDAKVVGFVTVRRNTKNQIGMYRPRLQVITPDGKVEFQGSETVDFNVRNWCEGKTAFMDIYVLNGYVHLDVKTLKNYRRSALVVSDSDHEGMTWFLNTVKASLPQAMILPTHRDWDAVDWRGTRKLWEQELETHEIGYFAYVKFCKPVGQDGPITPLVAGKSGSTLVQSRDDLSFSTERSHGPARAKLDDEGKQWVQTHVLVVPADTEQDAYAIERWLQNEYGLLGS